MLVVVVDRGRPRVDLVMGPERVGCLSVIPFFDINEQEKLKIELPAYLA